MTAMTTSSSMSVKPRRSGAQVFAVGVLDRSVFISLGGWLSASLLCRTAGVGKCVFLRTPPIFFQSVFCEWVPRATHPPRWATHRLELPPVMLRNGRSRYLETLFPFRPACRLCCRAHLATSTTGPRTVPVRSSIAGGKAQECSRPPRPSGGPPALRWECQEAPHGCLIWFAALLCIT